MSKILRSKVVSPTRLERGHEKAKKKVYPEGHYGATLRNIRIAPRKARLVVDQIRGEPVERAREILRFNSKRAAYLLDRVLLSALGNADAKSYGRVGAAELVVAECYCDESQRLKRWKAGPKGGVRPIKRRMAHLTVVLAEKPEDAEASAAGKGKGKKKATKKTKKKAAKAE